MPLAYNLALLLGSPLLALYLVYRLAIKGKSRDGLPERLGFSPRLPAPPPEGRVWLHAVSAGEVVAAAAIARRLAEIRPGIELVVSTTTPAGQLQARKLLPGARAWFYFPFDFLPCVALSLARVQPTVAALVETEIWPNWLWLARLTGVRTALLNGQFADKGFNKARKARFLYRWALGELETLQMQNRTAAERALFLGAPAERVRVVGNAKFEQVLPPLRPELSRLVRSAFSLDHGRKLWIAGSTHPGEEEQVLEAFRQARKRVPGLALLLAPRHVERASEVSALLEAQGWSHARRSQDPAGPVDVLLLDTMGELAALFSLADVVFLGGSLVPIGGHDLLQPIYQGKPTLFGPHMHNQHDMAILALEAGAAMQVQSASELTEAVISLCLEPELSERIHAAGERLLRENGGAAREYALLLASMAAGGPVPGQEKLDPATEVPA